MFIIATGFTRIKGNYGGQIAKGIGVGLLTLGMVVPTPIKANSAVHAMIVDAKEDNVAFYQRSRQEKEPLNEQVLRLQLTEIFKGYFY